MAKVKTGSPEEGRAVVRVVGDKAKICKRPDSNVWQMKVRIRAGKWFRASTGTEDQKEAEKIALQKAHEVAKDKRVGPMNSVKIDDLAESYERYLKLNKRARDSGTTSDRLEAPGALFRGSEGHPYFHRRCGGLQRQAP